MAEEQQFRPIFNTFADGDVISRPVLETIFRSLGGELKNVTSTELTEFSFEHFCELLRQFQSTHHTYARDKREQLRNCLAVFTQDDCIAVKDIQRALNSQESPDEVASLLAQAGLHPDEVVDLEGLIQLLVE